MKTFLALIGAIVLILVVGLILTYPLMLMLNYVFASSFLTALFGVAKLGFWRTYFLSLAASWLFKSTTSSK